MRSTQWNSVLCALKSATILAGLALVAPTGAAANPAAAPGQTTAEPQAGAPAADKAPDIVVTGSRISRRDYNSSSPISTVSSVAIEAAGAPSLDRAIGQLPQFAAAQGAAEVGDAQGNIGFSGGQSYSDLRGLGPNRSLVLLDGRRLVSSSPDGSIDLNTIPTALIDSVEVITGGASAAYGSDAVAGVVNFKLKQKFSGLELSARHGQTTEGDGATNQISAILGGNFAEGRGNAVLAVEYADRATVEGATRPLFSNIRQLARPPEGILAAGNFGGGTPSIAAVNAVLAGYSGTTPIVGTGAYRGAIGVNTDGTLFTTGASPNCVQNYRGLGTIRGVNISPNCTAVQVALGQYFAVQVPLTKYQAFAKTTYQLSDHITTYAQFSYLESSALDQTAPGSSKASVPLIVPLNNPFVTGNAALQSVLGSGTPATGNLILTKLLSAFGNRVETYKYDVWQGQIGFKGDIPGTQLHWDVYATLGHTQFVNNVAGDVSLSSVNRILNGTAAAQGCTGYAWNPLGNNPVSAGCLAFAGRTLHNTNTQSQRVVEGTLEGPLFTLPAGDLHFAAGVDYRHTRFDYQPDNALVVNDSLPFGSTTLAGGTQKVSEVFGELLVPIFKEQPFAQELSLDLGYRYSRYEQTGKYDTVARKFNATTWKADVSWQPADILRIRGGYSVAIRAPSLGDLYGPTIVAQQNIGTLPSAGDPCAVTSIFRTGANAAQVATLCAAQGIPAALLPTYTYGIASVQGSSGANATLTPEKAKTWSAGFVVTPKLGSELFRNIQLTVDYYNIKISGAIGSLNLTDILPRCYNSDGISNPTYSLNNPYCQRTARDPATGVIISGQQGLFNFATYTVSGIDAQLNWRFGLDALGMSAKAGKIEFGTVVSYLKDYTVAGLLGSPTLNYAGSAGFGGVGGDISHPKWKANTTLGYTNGGFGVAVHWRYIGSMVHSDVVVNAASTTAGVPAYSYFDLEAHYTLNARFTLGVGLNNVFDKGPPFISAASLTTDAALYDVIGRTWNVSVRAKF